MRISDWSSDVCSSDLKLGETRINAKGRKILALPSQAPNFHWTRNLIASADGSLLYVAVGSASNIAEYGLDKEENRANILEVNPKTGSYRKIGRASCRESVCQYV